MISLQCHNQVLYHLTQLTSAVGPKSTPLPVKVKRQNESFKKNRDKASHCGMPEVTKNNIEMSIDKLSMYEATTIFKMRRTNAWVMLDQLSMNICKRHLSENFKWKVSYVSKSSFAKNKQSFPCAPLTEPIVLSAMYLSPKQYKTMCMLCVNNPFLYHAQTRNFKTERAMKKVDLGGNISFMGKLKNWIYTQRNETGTTVLYNVKDLDYDKLKNLLNTREMTPEEKHRIRYAFMEGFEAGIHRQIQSRFPWLKAFQNLLATVLIVVGLWMMTTPGSMLRFSMKPRGEINPEIINETFEDVKGIEEAKEELRDIVEYLKNPEKFSVLGGKLPKGVLLVGPPGTGKTLLARAVAGEASVPFFHASGSEFDEILVGQGARRVRDLFNAAKEKAPAVIFIDEIDSVGAKRTASVLHPYANQTINQLLAEMDGFVQNEGVIVLGATNRREDLDKALMRPGRFDVQIFVDKPDYLGRKEIINLYLSKVLSRDIDVDYLARCTSGFTGADIENMINQAALAAAKADAPCITMEHIEHAQDKVQMGPAGKVKNNSDESIRIAAYHEAGHTLVGHFTKDVLPLRKVTIIPRGPSLGHTQYIPSKDEGLETRSHLLGLMDTLMGGRAAEELVFGPDKVTTGALSDFSKATDIAEKMVKYYGMSDKVGFRIHGDMSKMGVESNGDPSYGPSTRELIDNEVKRLLQESYERAKALLKIHAKAHKRLAESLLKYETLTADEVKAIIEGKKTQAETISNSAIIVETGKQVI